MDCTCFKMLLSHAVIISVCALEHDDNFFEGFLDPDDFKVNGSVRRQVKTMRRREGPIKIFE